MSIDTDTLLATFVQLSETGGLFLPPPRNSLGEFVPPLAGLTRENNQPDGIVLQGNDGGDSANRTGVLAFCNSNVDKTLLPQFDTAPGVMVRHSTQYPNPVDHGKPVVG